MEFCISCAPAIIGTVATVGAMEQHSSNLEAAAEVREQAVTYTSDHCEGHEGAPDADSGEIEGEDDDRWDALRDRGVEVGKATHEISMGIVNWVLDAFGLVMRFVRILAPWVNTNGFNPVIGAAGTVRQARGILGRLGGFIPDKTSDETDDTPPPPDGFVNLEHNIDLPCREKVENVSFQGKWSQRLADFARKRVTRAVRERLSANIYSIIAMIGSLSAKQIITLQNMVLGKIPMYGAIMSQLRQSGVLQCFEFPSALELNDALFEDVQRRCQIGFNNIFFLVFGM